jgi:hypothetical protein
VVELRDRTAVNPEDRRVALAGHVADRLHQHALDLGAVRALEADRLHGRKLLRTQELVVIRDRPQALLLDGGDRVRVHVIAAEHGDASIRRDRVVVVVSKTARERGDLSALRVDA